MIWFANWRLWLKLSVIPLVFVIATGFIDDVSGAPDGGFASGSFDPSLLIFLVYLVQIPLATAWHRLILQPHQTAGHRYVIGSNDCLYLLRGLILIVFVVGAFILGGILSATVSASVVALMPEPPIFQAITMTFVIGVSVYLAVGYFMCPLLLMLPAASVGKKLRGREVYTIVRDSRNNGRLLTIYVLVLAPIMFIGWVVAGIAEKMNSGGSVFDKFRAIGIQGALHARSFRRDLNRLPRTGAEAGGSGRETCLEISRNLFPRSCTEGPFLRSHRCSPWTPGTGPGINGGGVTARVDP